ncbi:methionine aminotransferase [Fulvivirga maritima]|uniref:methionine aminotransferase n=1 Tax=Fulvivirga maritima TaxID=2904247 RepID=UPI001F31A8A8|nr:methionine aminotransferase [Fulvivirga maritima]UII28592.1 methionine aminotransferase [Fulvivirga maritima]
MSSLVSKLPEVGTTIFSIMSKMAHDNGAINLSQGFPDFPVSPELIELVNYHMQQGHNQYAPMPGAPSLRQRIADLFHNQYQLTINPETEVTVTAGATEALFVAIQAVVQPGDEVIVFDPAYDSYAPAITLSGGKPIHLELNWPDFSINWQQLAETITSKTRLIIINSPHNPSGTVLISEDLKELESLSKKHKQLFVLSDEVYEHITFDGNNHKTVMQYPELAKKSMAVFSFGKTFHATGWKVGYIIAPEYITKEIRKIHQYVTFSVNTATQMALADFLEDESHYNSISNFYQEKRDVFLEGIKKSRFKPLPSKGTYFQLLSYNGISELGDVAMAEWLTKEHKVASIPISVFNQSKTDHKVLRFCFAKNESTLSKATEILCKI